MCGYVICESLRLIHVFFSVMGGHLANELEHFYFCERTLDATATDIFGFESTKGLKNAKHLFSELLGTEPHKVGLIQHFSILVVKRNLLVILAVMSCDPRGRWFAVNALHHIFVMCSTCFSIFFQ